MHHMQTLEQQATEWMMASAEVCAATEVGDRGGLRHEAGEAGELAHAAVLGYN